MDAPHLAEIFVATDPWHLGNSLITWAVVMRGTWIMAPCVYLGSCGPALKYKSALLVARTVWLTPGFQAEFPEIFQLVAYLLNVCRHKWVIVLDACAYCTAKAKAEREKCPSRVLALMTDVEADAHKLDHAFGPTAFLEFVSIVDNARTSLGLLRM